jgi:peroxiredoxin
LRAHEHAFRERGANLAAIGLGDANYARLFQEEAGIRFPLLIDEERLAYRAAGSAAEREQDRARPGAVGWTSAA